MRARTPRSLFLLVAVSLVAACSGGGDITDSGDDATTASQGPVETVAPGETAPAATTTTIALDLLPDCPTDVGSGLGYHRDHVLAQHVCSAG